MLFDFDKHGTRDLVSSPNPRAGNCITQLTVNVMPRQTSVPSSFIMSAVTSSNRHLHHLPPVMELTPPTPPPSEAGMFEKDDLEFRTITTLLNILGTRERITLDNFQVSSDQRPRLKLLAALSSLLVRDHEIVAVMPKRSGRGSTLFVGAAAETPSEAAFRDDEPTPSLESSASSASSTSSHHNYITRNPRYKDPVGPVELLKNPTVEVGADIFEFIEQNWSVTL